MTVEHGAAAPVQILPIEGLPDFRPGDDLAGALATAAPWLRDGDVVVVTSKVVSKCEGRIVAAPVDPEERDELRRKLIEQEAVRVLARKGRTLITENSFGLIQAAAGVDGSNVSRGELALLPTNPDASAAELRTRLREALGVDVAVIITDTMGRAWRTGQTDAAIGAAGLTVLHHYAGAVDEHGNDLVVTEVAVADELAAAADLVKGKLTGVPVAVVRGLRLPDDGSTGADLLRAGTDDLFWLGAAEAIDLGHDTPRVVARAASAYRGRDEVAGAGSRRSGDVRAPAAPRHHQPAGQRAPGGGVPGRQAARGRLRRDGDRERADPRQPGHALPRRRPGRAAAPGGAPRRGRGRSHAVAAAAVLGRDRRRLPVGPRRDRHEEHGGDERGDFSYAGVQRFR